jgi:hypothetical protein
VYAGKVPGVLTEEQVWKLNAIGMEWGNRQESQWEEGFRHARRYFEKYGSLDVTARYIDEDGFTLGVWIMNQRQKRVVGSRQGMLSEERIRRLDEIGMIWEKGSFQWERNYQAAVEYFQDHGDLNVPYGYVSKDGIKLGIWLTNLRQTRRGSRSEAAELTAEQIARLDAVGMNWGNKHQVHWEDRYADAKAYYERHGDLNVPIGYVTENGVALGKWLYRQRTSGKLSREQWNRLRAIRVEGGTVNDGLVV